jgi:hypothetical protein
MPWIVRGAMTGPLPSNTGMIFTSGTATIRENRNRDPNVLEVPSNIQNVSDQWPYVTVCKGKATGETTSQCIVTFKYGRAMNDISPFIIQKMKPPITEIIFWLPFLNLVVVHQGDREPEDEIYTDTWTMRLFLGLLFISIE